MASPLSQPIKLPCGLVLPNRLAKAAMTEQMADSHKLPRPAQFSRSYGAWADGGWGMILTGHVQINMRYLGAMDDLSIDPALSQEEQVLAAYKSLAETIRHNGTPAIMQLNHPGRQSPLGAGKRGFMDKTIAPSAVPLDFGPGLLSKAVTKLMFGTPREMSISDIEDVVQRFANSARVAAAAGFDGVEIHAAHGYLLAQFLSAKTNLRDDAYGGSPKARTKIVVDIIQAIRAVVPQTFCLGLKLNSADQQPDKPQSHTELADCIEQVTTIAGAGLDFLEISGGSYENPMMMIGRGEGQNAQVSKRTAARESFFLDFAREIRKSLPDTVLMVTGGFRTRKGMEAAVTEGACDIVGIGRPAVLEPSLPRNIILNGKISDEQAKACAKRVDTPWLLKQLGPRSVGAGYESAWYSKKIQSMED